MSVNQVNNLLYFLTIASQIFIFFIIVSFLFYKKHIYKSTNIIVKNAIFLAFLVSLTATLGSLYYSEIAGFPPCDLCWFQRIFMYPQTLILGLALWKKENYIIDYSLSMVIVGFLISLYHNYIYYTAQTSTFCSIITPCTQKYILGFGYISIPLMALVAFIMMALLIIN